MGRYCFHYLSSTSHHQEPTVPVPYISYECEARIVQTDTMSVTEFENDWILLAKKAVLPVTGGGGGGGGF